MNSNSNQESEFTSMAERHHQIMMEGTRFLKRLAWIVAFIIVLIVGAICFFFFKESIPLSFIFSRYP